MLNRHTGCGRTRIRVAPALLGAALAFSLNAQAAIYETTYSHDTLNGLVTETNPNGEVIQYHHDAVDRLTKIVLDAGASPAELNFTWDLTDQLERITYPGGAQDFTYDNLDRLETITDFGSSGPLLHFSYDHQDRVTWIVYSASNGAVCYEYDPDGRITRVGRVFSGSGTVCGAADEKTDYSYDGKGRLSTVTHPNGITGFIEYDAITGQMKSAGYRRENGTLIYRDEFTYVPGTPLYARITRTTATDSTSTDYTYDAWQRLTSVIEADGRKTAYEYDPFGNRTRETITNVHGPEATGGEPKAYGDYTYEYGARSNRLTRILKDGVELETFSYDNAGRMTERTHATDGTTTYSYDPRGLLTGVIKPGSTISYTYDALGARKTKTVNGVTTRYLTAPLFGMSRVLAELDTSMNFKATYVYGGHQLLKEEPVAGDHGKDLYLLADGIVGSITHAVDGDGMIKNQYSYDAFGIRSPLTSTPSDSHGHYGYTGQEYDEEAGLLYLRARYYDPTIGRFISADPFWGRLEEPASQNRYAYVKNNPLLYTDPSGLDFVWEEIDWGMVRDSSMGLVYGVGTLIGGGATIYGGLQMASTGLGAVGAVPVVSAGGYFIGQGSYEIVQHGQNLWEATFGGKGNYNQDINYGSAIAPQFGFDQSSGREFQHRLGEANLMLPPSGKLDAFAKTINWIQYTNDYADSGCVTCPCK